MRDFIEAHHTFGRAMLDIWVVPEPSRFIQMKHPLNGSWWMLDQATGRVVDHSANGPFPNVAVVGVSESLAAPPASPVDGNSADPAVHVHAGTGDGRVRAPQPGFPTPFDHAFAAISAVYDAALSIVRAAPPMPL